jgi:protein-disulfide isomerase
MNERQRAGRTLSRRTFLGGVGASTVALAGCLGGGTAEGSENVPVRGDPDADVTLEVYEDFTCPHCQTYERETFPQVQEAYLDPGLIRYEHRDYPFLGPEAWQASSAVREVYEENGNDRFWEYKSALMARGGEIESGAPEVFGSVAEELTLDAESIQSAAADRVHDDAAEADKERGQSLGVNGTPSFVVDGQLMDGQRAAFERINEEVQ